jgi:threonine dehydrogenase-like Zn-dependent dehydrogenase
LRALVFGPSLSFDARRPEPALADGDALLRVRQAGICATDLEITKGYMGYRGVLGHEFVADVLDAPDAALVGKRVVGEINCPCGSCDLCAAGLPTHCRRRTVLGILNHDGAFADLVRLPSANLHVLPDAVDDDAAVFVEPLAAAFQIVHQIGPPTGNRRSTTVLGDGRLGLLCGQVLHAAGFAVRLLGRHHNKLALCARWGFAAALSADVAPAHDQDVVVDCTGSAAGLERAMATVRPRGTIVLKSTVAAGAAVNLAPLVIDEVTVIGSRCGPFPDAIRALADRRVDVTSLIHRRMPIEQGVEAMRLAGSPGVLKVLLTMGPPD